MSTNPNDIPIGGGGGGGIIIGDQPLSYWLTAFNVRLSTPEKRLRCAQLVQQYLSSTMLAPSDTQFLMACATEIAASLDGV